MGGIGSPRCVTNNTGDDSCGVIAGEPPTLYSWCGRRLPGKFGGAQNNCFTDVGSELHRTPSCVRAERAALLEHPRKVLAVFLTRYIKKL
jgi:hypothetical protein